MSPKRPSLSSNIGYSPVSLSENPAAVSPQRNLTGLPRVARDLAADVYNNIQKWNGLHIRGAQIIKQIATLKSDNAKSFSPPLEELAIDLYNVVQGLRPLVDQLKGLLTQMRSLIKLQKLPAPIFISLDAEQLTKLVRDISEAYEAELQVKEFALENIAHSKDKNQAMFYAALWTYQHKITDAINCKLEILLVETGHRKIS